MAILKVANIHHDASGFTRTQISPSNTYSIYTSNQERLRIDSVGNISISNNIITSGNVAISGNVSALTASFSDGSASAPSIAHIGDLDTGISFPTADNIGFNTGGIQRMIIDSSGVTNVNYLNVNPQDNVYEGGEVRLKGASTYSDFQLDNYAGSFRLHTLATNKWFQIIWTDGSTIDIYPNRIMATGNYISVPPGTIMYFASSTAPVGFLKCNGASISRTTYADLYTAIGITWGSDTGSTFKVPDLRGEFLRAWDDGANRDPGRGFATSQAASRVYYNNYSNGEGYGNGMFDVDDNIAADYEGGVETLTAGSARTGVSASGKSGRVQGIRVRPRNIAVLACIKY